MNVTSIDDIQVVVRDKEGNECLLSFPNPEYFDKDSAILLEELNGIKLWAVTTSDGVTQIGVTR